MVFLKSDYILKQNSVNAATLWSVDYAVFLSNLRYGITDHMTQNSDDYL